MTVAHVVCWDGFRGYGLGVAERVTVWCVARAGRTGNAVLTEGPSGDLEVLWLGVIMLPVLDFDHGLALVMDLGCR